MRWDWRSTGSAQVSPSQRRSAKMPAMNLASRAASVDVLDAQQEATAQRLGALEANEGGERVTEVQRAIGTGRET